MFVSSLSGCFYKAAFLVKHKSGTVHGILLQFAYSELEHATSYFSSSNLIGLGGSSYVYRGQLKDGRIVAIKRLKHEEGPDADLKFSTEVPHHCTTISCISNCMSFGIHTGSFCSGGPLIKTSSLPCGAFARLLLRISRETR